MTGGSRYVLGCAALSWMYLLALSCGLLLDGPGALRYSRFLTVSKLCSFFLFCKGRAIGRTSEQSYSFFVVVFEIASVFYLFWEGAVGWRWGCLCAINLAILKVVYLGVQNTKTRLPWRAYKRLLVNKEDVFFYHLRICCEVSVFVLRYFACAYLVAGERSVFEFGRVAGSEIFRCFFILGFLYMVSGKFLCKKTAGACGLLSLAAVSDALKTGALSSIFLFLLSAASFALSAVDLHRGWRSLRSVPRRVPIE